MSEESDKIAEEAPREIPIPAEAIIRPLDTAKDLSELNWVRRAWKSRCRAYPEFRHLPQQVYSVGMDKMIAYFALTQRLLLLVVPGEGRDKVLGFICYRQLAAGDPALVVHFVCIHPHHRRQGGAKALLLAAGWQPNLAIVASHQPTILPKTALQKYNVFSNRFFVIAGNI